MGVTVSGERAGDYASHVTSLLIRNTRPVPLRADERAPERPVDVLVERGSVTAVGPALERPAGVEEIDAEGRWLIPGLWDQHLHLDPVDPGLPAPRPVLGALARGGAAPGAPSGSPSAPASRSSAGGTGAGTWDREVTVSELDAVSGVDPGRADQRRRPPRLAQHHRADCTWRCRCATRWSARTSGSRPTALVTRLAGADETSPAAFRASLGRRGRAGRGRDRRLRVQRRARRLGARAGPRAATCCGCAGRRTPTAWSAVIAAGPAHRRPAAGLRRPASRWAR